MPRMLSVIGYVSKGGKGAWMGASECACRCFPGGKSASAGEAGIRARTGRCGGEDPRPSKTIHA